MIIQASDFYGFEAKRDLALSYGGKNSKTLQMVTVIKDNPQVTYQVIVNGEVKIKTVIFDEAVEIYNRY